MMNTSLMFSSATDLWSTPQDFFDRLNEEFHFVCDVCATTQNAKCANYFTKETDALAQAWLGVCWMNPPYGREIGKWVRKAYESARKNDFTTVVCLLPARTDTAWWHDYCMKGEVRFIRGRLKFGGQTNSAPFPSAVVIFRATSCQCPDDKTMRLKDEIAILSRAVDQDFDDFRELAEYDYVDKVVGPALARHETLRMDKMAAMAGVVKPQEAR